MEETPRRIEIFAPFEAALEVTKRILFQPFELGKWCAIGFAAFLASFGSGSSTGHVPTNWGNKSWDFRSATRDVTGGSVEAWPSWMIPLLVGVGLAIVVLVVVLMWLGARGQFMFADCVVRNRGAIVAPWNEYKREGNSLFLFRLTVAFLSLLVVGLAAIPLWLPLVSQGRKPEGAGLVVGLILVGGVVLVVGLGLALASYFMVPIMYRRRCGAVQGFRESAGVLMSEPGPVILFFLFKIVLAVAVALVACALTCMTCCIAAIPYVGTVIMLPLFVFALNYQLLFLRQFGPEYDVWAGLAPAVPLAPPVQEVPPPTEPPTLP
ncbi:MAG: hypothetical protein ABIR71_07865 [Chthoniobacterales bacterium]